MTDAPLCCGECHRPLGDEPIFAKTNNGPRYCKPCWQIVDAEQIALDAKTDRWHDGYFAKERPTDPDMLEGWLQAREDAKRPMPRIERPEGYYHAPIGTFD